MQEILDEYIYLFDLSLDGLLPVPQEDGSIYLYVDVEDEEPLFILEAPYMYDAAGEESLPDGSVVTNATLQVKQITGNAYPDRYLYMFETPRDALGISCTWNNQPFSQAANGPSNDGEKLLDYAVISGTGSVYSLDLTKAVRNWYENNNNEGVMICSSDEKKYQTFRLASSRSADNDGPLVTIQYSNNIGLEDYWSYETIGMGRSGTAYVNDYNGALTYVHSDLAMTGNRLPIGIR